MSTVVFYTHVVSCLLSGVEPFLWTHRASRHLWARILCKFGDLSVDFIPQLTQSSSNVEHVLHSNYRVVCHLHLSQYSPPSFDVLSSLSLIFTIILSPDTIPSTLSCPL